VLNYRSYHKNKTGYPFFGPPCIGLHNFSGHSFLAYTYRLVKSEHVNVCRVTSKIFWGSSSETWGRIKKVGSARHWVTPSICSPECWRTAHLLGKQVRSLFIATARPSLVAGTAANRLKHCCSCVSVSARTCSGVPLQSIKDLPSRQRLRSWSSDTLAVPTSNLSTVGDRAFPIAAARVWNTLSPDIRSSSSLSTFKRRLKSELFSRSFPD